MVFLTDDPLGFDTEGGAIDRRFTDRIAELIDGISISVQALHDPKRPSIDGRAKETRDRRVPQILG